MFEIVNVLMNQKDDSVESKVLFNEFGKINFFHFLDIVIKDHECCFVFFIDINIGKRELLSFSEVHSGLG